MSDLHFVLEHPQDNNRREHKKRPRLVTSCDNWCVSSSKIRFSFRALIPQSFPPSHSSRAKKLKCIKGGENAPCESCATSGVTCEFRDRDQYFAERSAKSVNAAGNSPGSQRPQLSPRARSTVPEYTPNRGTDTSKRPGSSRSQRSTKSLSSVQFLLTPRIEPKLTRMPGAPRFFRPIVHNQHTTRGPPSRTRPPRHYLTPTYGRDRIQC